MQMSFRFGPICGAADVRQLSHEVDMPCPECNPNGEPTPVEIKSKSCPRCSGVRWIDPGGEMFWAMRKVADEFESKGYASERSWEELKAVIALFAKKEGQS